VHARGNALVLEASVPGPALLGALNAIAPDIWFTRAAQVPEEFRVRSARERWYRYFETGPVGRRRDWVAAAARFRGPIDVRSFSRGLPPTVPCVRDVAPIRLRFHDDMLLLDVRGRSFVWGMVRKIVAALRAHAAGTLSLEAIDAAVSGERRLSLPLAEPDRLVLWEVRHTVRWTARSGAATRGRAHRFSAETDRARVRVRVMEALDPMPGGRP